MAIEVGSNSGSAPGTGYEATPFTIYNISVFSSYSDICTLTILEFLYTDKYRKLQFQAGN